MPKGTFFGGKKGGSQGGIGGLDNLLFPDLGGRYATIILAEFNPPKPTERGDKLTQVINEGAILNYSTEDLSGLAPLLFKGQIERPVDIEKIDLDAFVKANAFDKAKEQSPSVLTQVKIGREMGVDASSMPKTLKNILDQLNMGQVANDIVLPGQSISSIHAYMGVYPVRPSMFASDRYDKIFFVDVSRNGTSLITTFNGAIYPTEGLIVGDQVAPYPEERVWLKKYDEARKMHYFGIPGKKGTSVWGKDFPPAELKFTTPTEDDGLGRKVTTVEDDGTINFMHGQKKIQSPHYAVIEYANDGSIRTKLHHQAAEIFSLNPLKGYQRAVMLFGATYEPMQFNVDIGDFHQLPGYKKDPQKIIQYLTEAKAQFVLAIAFDAEAFQKQGGR